MVYWERPDSILCRPCSCPSPISCKYCLLLQSGLEGREQHSVRGLPVAHVLLRRGTGPVQRGHVQPGARVRQAELLVHRWTLGADGRALHPLLCRQVQHVSRLHRLFQHVGRGLPAVRAGHVVKPVGQEHRL